MASIRPSKKISGALAGAVGRNSGPWDPWLAVVENSRFFAQRGHSAGTAHGAPPMSIDANGMPCNGRQKVMPSGKGLAVK